MAFVSIGKEREQVSKKNSPAFQFYPADYLADGKVQMLTLEQEGAYIRLLCFYWREGTLPSDPVLLRRLIGKDCSEDTARVVAKCFTLHPNDPSRVVHFRLEEEREKQAEWSLKSSEGGKKSAQIRGEKAKARILSEPCEVKGGCEMVSTNAQPNVNIASTSSITSINTNTPLTPLKRGKRLRADKYRDFDESDFDWPPSWANGARTAMRDWVEYKTKSGHAAILETYKRQVQVFAKDPRHFAALVSRAITKGWQGLNEQMPLEPRQNGFHPRPENTQNLAQSKPFEPPPRYEPTAEERERVKKMIGEKFPVVRGIS